MQETEYSRERGLAVDACASHPALFYLRSDTPIRENRGPMQGEAGFDGKPAVIAEERAKPQRKPRPCMVVPG